MKKSELKNMIKEVVFNRKTGLNRGYKNDNIMDQTELDFDGFKMFVNSIEVRLPKKFWNKFGESNKDLTRNLDVWGDLLITSLKNYLLG